MESNNDSIDIDIRSPIDVYITSSFNFVKKETKNILDRNEIEKCINEAKNKDHAFDLDDAGLAETLDYTFSELITDNQIFPYRIGINNNNKTTLTAITTERPVESENKSGGPIARVSDDVHLESSNVFLSQYGVGYVRLHYQINLDALDLAEYMDCIYNCREHAGLSSIQEKSTEDDRAYALEVWNEFSKMWNENCNIAIENNAEIVDYYSVTRCRGIDIGTNGKTHSAVKILNDKCEIKHEKKIGVMRRIIGLNNLSYSLWQDYSESYVEKEFERDVATSQVEIQLINWKHTIILRDDKASSVDSNFDDYFDDLLIGLEILLVMRSSLRLLEARLSEQNGPLPKSNGSVLSTINPNYIQRFYQNIEYYDKWITDIKEWRRIGRHAGIQHYHSFLNVAVDEMRVKEWLEASDEKLDQTREMYHAHSDKIESINQTILSIAIALLSVILALPVIWDIITGIF